MKTIFEKIFFWKKQKNNMNMWENLKSIDLAKLQVVNYSENKFFQRGYSNFR